MNAQHCSVACIGANGSLPYVRQRTDNSFGMAYKHSYIHCRNRQSHPTRSVHLMSRAASVQLVRYPGTTLSRLLRIGTSPESLALGIALGVACGLFPLFGTATVLCAIVGAMFRVNPVLIQTVNYAMYPIYFPVLALLVVAGQCLFGDKHDVATMIHLAILQDNAGWWRTLGRLARLLAHAVFLWLLLAPPMVLLLRRLLLPWMRRIVRYRSGSTASPQSPHMKVPAPNNPSSPMTIR